jgi:hypothetical protein
MSRASALATSTTKIDARTDRKAFVTLRFAGDDLDLREISAILPVAPTRAHRKGEEFVAGQHAGNLRGRTGIWFLATDKIVHSDDLGDHMRFVHKLLYPEPTDISRITQLRDILGRAHSHAHITCFWHGDPGETAPQIPDRFRSAIEPLAADVETDFAVDKQITMRDHADTPRVNTALLMEHIGKWIIKITTDEFREYKRRQLRYVLAEDFEYELGLVKVGENFAFGDPVDKQHQLVMSYLYLSQALSVLSQSEFYFRRYPFSKSPVSREDHARNMCEFYFGQFYIIQNRVKEVLNNFKAIDPGHAVDVGKFLKAFKKEFKQELSMRNGVIHHEPFEDLDLDRLFVTRVILTSPDLKGKGWDKEHLHYYRKFAARWSKRAKRRSADAQIFLEEIALLLLDHADFLRE